MAAAPRLKPFKFNVQAVVLEVDAAGDVVGERPGDVLTIYGAAALEEWARNFETNLPQATVRDEPPSETAPRKATQ